MLPKTIKFNPLTLTNMSTIIYDVIGNPIEVKSHHYIVTATDKAMSGWGRAEGKTHKQIVICEDWSQMCRVKRNLRQQGFTYVNDCIRLPKYSSTRYTWSYHHANDCPIWNK